MEASVKGLRFEHLDGDGERRVLNLLLPSELWARIEALHAELRKRGDKRTLEQVMADVLDVGLAMTTGTG